MRLLMDADCLIKLTKAGLKEAVCRSNHVAIPSVVHDEVVVAGLARGHGDAAVVAANVENALIELTASGESESGDAALLPCFRAAPYDAVATDDARLVRRLRLAGVPVAVPGVLVLDLYRRRALDRVQAVAAIEALSPFISGEEHAAARLLLEREP